MKAHMIKYNVQDLMDQFMEYAPFCPYNGLFNGKMGIALLFYRYGNRTCKTIYTKAADDLLDTVFDSISTNLTIDFKTGLSGIAWGIHYLLDNHFLEFAESKNQDDLFLQVDQIIWDRNTLLSLSIQDLFYLSLYLKKKTLYFNQKEWTNRCLMFCEIIKDKILERRYLQDKLPLYSCESLLALFDFSSALNDIPRFEGLQQEFVETLGDSIYFSIEQERSLTSKLFLYRFLKQKAPLLNVPEEKDLEKDLSVTWKDFNQFYLLRLLYKNVGKLPDSYQNKLNEIVSDTNLLQSHLSLLSSNSIGLDFFLPGLVWGLLGYEQDNK